MNNEELEYKTLNLLESNPEISQRQVSVELGVSLGKAHYVLKALIEIGLVKLENFRQSRNKLRYSYVLTPAGIAEKTKITMRFLDRKKLEYVNLKAEIQALEDELEKNQRGNNSFWRGYEKPD